MNSWITRSVFWVSLQTDCKSSSESQGQSVGSGEKARRKFLSKGGGAPRYLLSPDHFQKFKRMPAPDWAQKMLCIIVPNRRAHLLSSFRVFVHDSYCLDHGLSGSCTKEMHAVRKLSVWYKIPIWSNSLTLSNASELFWSWISINHIQVHKEKENFVIACLRPSQNVKLGIFTGSLAVDGKEMYKKAWCTCKVVVLPCQAIAYLTFSSPLHLKLPIIYDTLWSVKNRIFGPVQLLLLIASQTFFQLVDSFWLEK